MPYLKELINNHKAIKNGSNEWKIQLNARIKFVSLNDTEDICTFFVWSKMKKLDQAMKQMILLKVLLILF